MRGTEKKKTLVLMWLENMLTSPVGDRLSLVQVTISETIRDSAYTNSFRLITGELI